MKYKYTKTVYFDSHLDIEELEDLQETDFEALESLVDRQETRTTTALSQEVEE